jgi:hypothetical protein
MTTNTVRVCLVAVIALLAGTIVSGFETAPDSPIEGCTEQRCIPCMKVEASVCRTADCSAPALHEFQESIEPPGQALQLKVESKRVSVAAMVRQALTDQRRMLLLKAAELERWSAADRAGFAKWFGSTDDEARKRVRDRIAVVLKVNANYSAGNFRRAEKPRPGIFAYVRPADPTRVFLDGAFVTAPAIGANSKAGTLSHEMSHFTIAGGTQDHAYGEAKCRELARTKPELALTNADNFEYFLEGAK